MAGDLSLQIFFSTHMRNVLSEVTDDACLSNVDPDKRNSCIIVCMRRSPIIRSLKTPERITVDAQADLNLRWAHMQSYRKCGALAHT